MAKVNVRFNDEQIVDLGSELRAKLRQPHIMEKVKPGMEIAIAVGSRGLDRIVELTA
ncbi:hypothetical protein BGX30_015243, partial [Mortierella sp. GBA39]